MLGKHILAVSIRHYLASKDDPGEGVGAHMPLKEGSPPTEVSASRQPMSKIPKI